MAAVLLALSMSACKKQEVDNTVSLGGYQASKYDMIIDSADKVNCDYLLVYNDTASYAEVDACVD